MVLAHDTLETTDWLNNKQQIVIVIANLSISQTLRKNKQQKKPNINKLVFKLPDKNLIKLMQLQNSGKNIV